MPLQIGDLEGYIDRTVMISVYCSKGYFQSKNCMRELIAAKKKDKPILALVDPDASRGGLSTEEVKTQLVETEASYGKWNFDAATTPSGLVLYDHLFASDPIEWNRIGASPAIGQPVAPPWAVANRVQPPHASTPLLLVRWQATSKM